MSDGEKYAVVVPPELAEQWASLPSRDHDRLTERLARAARDAHAHPVEWPAGAPGVHRGRHRVIIGDLWALYTLNDQAGTVNVIGFGRVAPEARD